MEGSSPGMSSGLVSESLEEMSSAYNVCSTPCIRGCTPYECTIMMPKKLSIRIEFDEMKKCDYLEMVGFIEGERKVVALSMDNFVRTISKGVEVEDVDIIAHGGKSGYETLKTVCKSLETVSSLTNLNLRYLESQLSISDAEAIFQVLGVHKTLRKCYIDFERGIPTKAEIVKVLVDSLLQNPILQEFSLQFYGHGKSKSSSNEEVQQSNGVVNELGRYMMASSIVLTHLIANDLCGDELVQLADLLKDNKQLQVMHSCKMEGQYRESMIKIDEALPFNSCINSLFIRGLSMGDKEMKALVHALIPDAMTGIQPNTHLKDLCLSNVSIEDKEGVEQLTTLLLSNNSLTNLGLEELNIYQEDNENVDEHVETLFKSLQSNASLQTLNLQLNRGIRGKHVLGMIMDMLLHNHTLKGIHLFGTGLEDDGDEEVVYAELRMRGEIDTKLEYAIQCLEHVPPNFARVFLCGNPEVGKTTLCNRWREIADKQAKVSIVKKKKNVLHKLFYCGATKKFEKGSASQKYAPLSNISERTRGIEVHKQVWKGIYISLWDMAGQLEYRAFHDLILPNQSAKGEGCFYFVVCDPSKYNSNDSKDNTISKLEKAIEYWLMFLASNTRHSASYRPHVTFVMTHHDNWQSDNFLCLVLTMVISKLKSKFEQVLDFDQDLGFIGMDNKKSCDDAEMVKGRVEQYLKQLCLKLPKVLKASLELQSTITQWCLTKGNDHIMKWEDFSRDLFEQVEGLKPSKDIDDECLEKLKKHTTKTLHSGGHILFFEDIDLVIMNPHWFCNHVIGNILYNCSKLSKTWSDVKDGIISQDHFVQLFKDVSSLGLDKDHHEDTLNIMKKLQICYEDQDDKIMIPSLLTDAQDSMDWSVAFHLSAQSFNFVGTKLKSKDDTMTLPSEGFFPRMQVFLHDKYGSTSYTIYMNIISFIYNDINVFIVWKDGSINIMSQSANSGDGDHAQHTLHKMIVMYINELRQKPTLGCPGVILEEHSIWPRSVEHPFNRKLESVSKKHLRDVVVRTGDLKYAYQWKDDNDHSGAIFASMLLGDEEWQKVLVLRAHMVKEMVTVLDQQLPTSSGGEKGPSSSTSSSDRVEHCGSNFEQLILANMDKNHQSMKRKIDEVMERLSIMESNIIHSQEALAVRVCSNIDGLMKHLILLKNSKIPKLPYIVQIDDSRKRCFLLKAVPGLKKCHLMFRCEHNDYGFHTMKDQPGCEILVGTENTRKFGTVMYWGLVTTTWLLKVGAHLAAPGMGNMVPDLAQELATILDTPGLLDMGQPKGPILNRLPEEFKINSAISLEDNVQAKEWLVNLLEGQSIYDLFNLTQVAYASKSSKKQEIGWVCDAHKP